MFLERKVVDLGNGVSLQWTLQACVTFGQGCAWRGLWLVRGCCLAATMLHGLSGGSNGMQWARGLGQNSQHGARLVVSADSAGSRPPARLHR